jgi:hypothetical protein
MNDLFRSAYADIIERSPEPPSWSEITTHTVRLTPTPRSNGPAMAAVAALVVVALFGGAAWLLRSPTPAAAATIGHLQLAWHQEVELRCLGMEAGDNGGYDRATIDIWGPNSDGYVRADITAPDGTVERVIEQFDHTGLPIQAWSTSQTMDSTVFRVADCTTRTQVSTTSYSVASPPHTPSGVPGLLFLTRSEGQLAERLAQSVESRRQLAAVTRSDSFDGTPVTVYVVEEDDGGVYDLGEGSRRFDLWIDEATGQVVRSTDVIESEILGSAATTLELVLVESVDAASVDFTTDDLTQTLDRRSQTSEADAVSTTTSIVPAAHPFMEDAVEIDVDEIPTEDLKGVIGARAGDTLYRVPFDRDVALIVRLRPGDRPHVYATACALLLQAGLPDRGWNGTCMEVTIDGERLTGPYSYAEARQLIPGG